MGRSQTKDSSQAKSSTISYSRREAAIVVASRFIHDHDVVFLGQGLPVIAALFAKRNHAPNCVIMHEYGVIDSDPPIAVELTHPLFAENATYLSDMIDALGSLIYHIDIAFLGAAQIDRYGNVNTTCIGDYFHPRRRISGSGGANDIGSLASRVVLIMDNQDADRFPTAVDYCTTPGYFNGSRRKRAELNLPGKGPEAVVTDLGMYRFSKGSGEMYLQSLQMNVTLDELKSRVGWKIKIARNLSFEPEPSEQEINLLRALDPRNVYLR